MVLIGSLIVWRRVSNSSPQTLKLTPYYPPYYALRVLQTLRISLDLSYSLSKYIRIFDLIRISLLTNTSPEIERILLESGVIEREFSAYESLVERSLSD